MYILIFLITYKRSAKEFMIHRSGVNMSKWFLSAKKADFESIAKKYHIDPVVARIMRNRDLITDEEIKKYLNGTEKDLHSYSLLKDMDCAIHILSEKIMKQKKIRIIGDYDVDGICSTYILYKGLTLCGGMVDTVIPHRIKDGYGINEQLIEDAIVQDIDTIVTCDNGIAAKDAFVYGKKAGLTCIITDHHEIPYEVNDGTRTYQLPEVDAIIDPKQEECNYPYKGICGAFVAYKLIEGMFEVFSIPKSAKKELLELCGFATICDVMELLDENRILVKMALSYMGDSDNLGLKALIKVNHLESDKLTSYHIGFVLGPCLNATGRLDTAQIALELLQSKSLEEAIVKATKLKELNESRREMTEQGMEEAFQVIEEKGIFHDKVLVVYLPGLHESLAGIIAGRVRERYGKPTFVLTKGEDGVKGSARSIETYHVYDEMTKCKEMFIKYGGHKMAAGLSLAEDMVEPFREMINENCTLREEDYEEKVVIDVPMPFAYVTEDLIYQLATLEPFGPGNEKPVFAQKHLTFQSGKPMGKNKNMAKFIVKDEGGRTFQLVLFRGLDRFKKYLDEKYESAVTSTLMEESFINNKSGPVVLDVIYYPSINVYRGVSTIQFIMQGYR